MYCENIRSVSFVLYSFLLNELYSSKADFITTPLAVHGSGRYYIRSGVGGKGWGLDLGLATKEMNGMRFGVSLINALGVIKWNEPSFLKDLLAGEDKKFGNSDDVWHLKWGGKALSDSVAAVPVQPDIFL